MQRGQIMSPVILAPNFDKIPQLLRNKNNWIVWNIGKLKPYGKYDKIPVNHSNGKAHNAHDPSIWLSFEEAEQAYSSGNFSGIGFVLDGQPVAKDDDGDELYLAGIDIDKCIKPNAEGTPTLTAETKTDLIDLGKPYFERSPSGTGIRAFMLSREKLTSHNKDGREMYFDKRFLTITGQVGGGKTEITEDTILLDAVHRRWFPTKQTTPSLPSNTGVARQPISESPEKVAELGNMLQWISANCSYDDYLKIIWAIEDTGWSIAETLAREWSMTAPDKFDEGTFQKIRASFKPDGGIHFGTLVHIAKQNGYQPPVGDIVFTGTGGDVENGRYFARIWRDKLLFVHETNEVLQFDSLTGWVAAPPGEADRAAKHVLAEMHQAASDLYRTSPDDPKTTRLIAEVKRTNKAPALRAMIDMAGSEQGMTSSLNDFDTDPMQLGVANGVLDLRTRHLLPVSPSLMVTKRGNVFYDRDATCPQWEQFLIDVQPDLDIREFLQRWVGYCLTGSVQEQKFIFLHGSGANGKSVFIELLAWLLGDYAKKIATEMLMQHQRSPQAASPDIVSLKGSRFVYANETEEGRKMAESKVKDMTGGDTLTGRVPYGKADISFSPTHKLAVVGNHKPEIGDCSNGMWRRVCLVPFDVTIDAKSRDPKLLEKLKVEGAGILNWALAGLQQWQQNGLAAPNKIEAATAAYRDEQDIIGEWLNDHCNIGPGRTAKKADLYRAYQHWMKNNGHSPLAQKRLTRRLGTSGYTMLPDKRTLSGLDLNQDGLAASNFP